MRKYKTSQQRELAEFFIKHGIRRMGSFPSMKMKRTKEGEFATIRVHTDALTEDQVKELRDRFFPVVNFPKEGFAIIDC